MTWGLRALVVLAAAVLVAGASGAQQRTYKRVVFIAIVGHGSVISKPAGLKCPADCRSAAFLKDEHVTLVAHPAAGWKFVKWSGTCTGKLSSCGFFLSDSHDCANGMCPIGAFGEHATFARLEGSG